MSQEPHLMLRSVSILLPVSCEIWAQLMEHLIPQQWKSISLQFYVAKTKSFLQYK